MAPEFFVPQPDGTHRDADDAERVYRLCREDAERQGGTVLDRRVYRLRFVHDGYRDELIATVGEVDPYGYKRLVVAIVPFSDHYWICSSAANHIVGAEAERHVEYFAAP